ncbi:alpha/beta hydrolase fold protein [Oleiphilus messinensis]|uniref:Alpha/beta hydrolase fold protein n=1 Tax=Oleiphilus messinensis TaxID=141451 RepID=A0A1Y0IER1_9GAMM|nr:alpha/beta fold hydrolase [Oleiphilus messinensis]ARU57863.1 alpha/beta hydrolase fold protein [Oleiphilus messinensis]
MTLMRIFIVLLLLGVTGCESMTAFYFHPSKPYYNDPQDFGIEYQEIVVPTEDGEQLVNWFFPASAPVKGYVVFFHGNAENISTHFASVYWLPEAGYSVFLADYRGFGKSTGHAVLPVVLDDMRAVFAAVVKLSHNDPQPVVVMGQSIGASLSVLAFSHARNFNPLNVPSRKPACMVIDSGFASFPGMVRNALSNSWLLWPLAYPVSWLFPSNFEPISYAADYTVPVLQFHSKDDRVVPFSQGIALRDAFQNVVWQETTGAHIATFAQQANRELLLSFLQGCHSGMQDKKVSFEGNLTEKSHPKR